MTESIEAFQISLDAAETYEAMFVPALFGEWAARTVEAADLEPGQSVLDVACGTGVVARAAADVVGSARVVGIDLNDSMLAVARRIRPDVDWRQGDATSLPLPDATFDVVTCQAALMFFPEPVRALREMRRVTLPTGKVVVQLWGPLDEQPAYRVLVDVASEVAGPDAVGLLSSYWVLGEPETQRSLFDAAGLDIVASNRRTGTVRFDSLEEFVRVEVEATPLIDRLDDDLYARLRDRACGALDAYEAPDGTVEVPIVGYVIEARPRP